MSPKSRTNSNGFDSRAVEAQAREAIRSARAAGWTWKEIGAETEADPSWAQKLEKGLIEHPSIHRIGRVIERLS